MGTEIGTTAIGTTAVRVYATNPLRCHEAILQSATANTGVVTVGSEEATQYIVVPEAPDVLVLHDVDLFNIWVISTATPEVLNYVAST